MTGGSPQRSSRLAIALGGGAALGWAHIGALRVLDEHGIKAHAVAGTSIGALVGACWIAGELDKLEEIARDMSWRRMIGYADPQLGGGGVFKGGMVVGELEKHLKAVRIENLPVRYAAVASDLISGREVVIASGPIETAIRASISVPGVFLPVERDGALLVDGGLVNPVPVTVARALGGELVLAIDVTGDYQGRARAAGLGVLAEPEKPRPPGTVASVLRELPRRLFRRKTGRPGLYEVATTSAALIMRELALAKMAVAPPDHHVVPQVGHISPVEFDRAEELIAACRKAMAAGVEALKESLAGRASAAL